MICKYFQTPCELSFHFLHGSNCSTKVNFDEVQFITDQFFILGSLWILFSSQLSFLSTKKLGIKFMANYWLFCLLVFLCAPISKHIYFTSLCYMYTVIYSNPSWNKVGHKWMYAIRPYGVLLVESSPSKVIWTIRGLIQLMFQFVNEPMELRLWWENDKINSVPVKQESKKL